MGKDIYDYVYVAKGIIEPQYIEWILDLSEECEWIQHSWSSPEDGHNPQSRTDGSELQVAIATEFSELDKLMREQVFKALDAYYNELKPRAWVSSITIPRFNKYSKNTDMREHVDHINLFPDENGRSRGIPVMSVVAVLTDDYEGGDFIFNGEKKIELNAGDILMFPSSFPWAHKVTPVTNGTRISYVTWAF